MAHRNTVIQMNDEQKNIVNVLDLNARDKVSRLLVKIWDSLVFDPDDSSFAVIYPDGSLGSAVIDLLSYFTGFSKLRPRDASLFEKYVLKNSGVLSKDLFIRKKWIKF